MSYDDGYVVSATTKKIIIPKGALESNATIIIEIPPHLRNSPTIIARRALPKADSLDSRNVNAQNDKTSQNLNSGQSMKPPTQQSDMRNCGSDCYEEIPSTQGQQNSKFYSENSDLYYKSNFQPQFASTPKATLARATYTPNITYNIPREYIYSGTRNYGQTPFPRMKGDLNTPAVYHPIVLTRTLEPIPEDDIINKSSETNINVSPRSEKSNWKAVPSINDGYMLDAPCNAGYYMYPNEHRSITTPLTPIETDIPKCGRHPCAHASETSITGEITDSFSQSDQINQNGACSSKQKVHVTDNQDRSHVGLTGKNFVNFCPQATSTQIETEPNAHTPVKKFTKSSSFQNEPCGSNKESVVRNTYPQAGTSVKACQLDELEAYELEKLQRDLKKWQEVRRNSNFDVSNVDTNT